jgi:hypothetical protein
VGVPPQDALVEGIGFPPPAALRRAIALVYDTRCGCVIRDAMNLPRDHHFIPAFYLKQWAGPDGKLIEHTRKGGKLIAKRVGPHSTGYERDLYAFPELPLHAAQFIEQVFFAYADQKASDALDNHLALAAFPWTSELVSAWSRFVIAIHLRHPDAMPELRVAATSLWHASGVDCQTRYDATRKPTDPPTFDE